MDNDDWRSLARDLTTALEHRNRRLSIARDALLQARTDVAWYSSRWQDADGDATTVEAYNEVSKRLAAIDKALEDSSHD
jgi:hypothetical protein